MPGLLDYDEDDVFNHLRNVGRNTMTDMDRSVTYRAAMLPYVEYADDSAGFGWPQFLANIPGALQRFGENVTGQRPFGAVDETGRPYYTDQQMQDDGNSLMALAGIGGASFLKSGNLTAISKGYANSLAADGVTSFKKSANIFEPPKVAQRPFEADYPRGAMADDAGRLSFDIEGRPLRARYIAGRQTLGGEDVAIPKTFTAADDIATATTGRDIAVLPPSQMPRGALGAFTKTPSELRLISLNRDLEARDAVPVAQHEIGHVIDDLAGDFARWESGVPINQIPEDGLAKELAALYHGLNDPTWRRTATTPPRYQFRPEDVGYSKAEAVQERMAEAIRAYMSDPNYIKTVAPKTAARIRKYVNEHPELSKTIQFNSLSGLGLLSGYNEQE